MAQSPWTDSHRRNQFCPDSCFNALLILFSPLFKYKFIGRVCRASSAADWSWPSAGIISRADRLPPLLGRIEESLRASVQTPPQNPPRQPVVTTGFRRSALWDCCSCCRRFSPADKIGMFHRNLFLSSRLASSGARRTSRCNWSKPRWEEITSRCCIFNLSLDQTPPFFLLSCRLNLTLGVGLKELKFKLLLTGC